MDFLYRTPFFRVFIPLIVGIIAFQYITVFSWSQVLILICSFIFVVFALLIKASKLQFQFRWLFGIGIFLFLFVTGYFLSVEREKRNVFQCLNKNGIVEVEILEMPIEKENSYLCRINTLHRIENSRTVPTKGKAIVYIQKDSLSAQLKSGDFLLIETTFIEPDGLVNPAGFDYKQYLKRQGIGATAYLSASSWRKVGENTHFSIFRLSEICQRKLLDVYKRFGIKGDEFAVLAALTLGSKDALHPELRQNYVTSGGMHILAVSGLHVGVIYMVLGFLFSLFIRNQRLKLFKSILIILCLWIYAFITGLPPSVIRSTIMFSMIALGSGLNRNSLIYNTIFASAFIMLLYNPDFLWDVGFQLSYTAVLSIVYFQPKISKWLCFKHPVLKWLWDLTAVSVAAQIGTAPFTLYYFHQFANYFILTNFVAIPFAMLIIYAAFALFVLSTVPYISIAIAFVLNWLLKILNFSIQFIHDLPYSVTYTTISHEQILLLLCLIVLLAFYVEYKKYFALVGATTLLLVFVSINLWINYKSITDSQLVVYSDNKNTHIDFIDGKEHFIYSTNLPSIEKVAQSYWLHRNLDEPQVVQSQSWYLDGFIQFGDKKICVLGDSMLTNRISTKLLAVDCLIIGNGIKPKMKQLMECIAPKQIIVDKTISKWYAHSIRSYCFEKKIKFYSVAEKGAYVLSFKD